MNLYLQNHRSDLRAYLILGDLYFNNENYFDAIANFYYAEALDTNNIHAKYYLALSLIGFSIITTLTAMVAIIIIRKFFGAIN